MEIFPGDGTDVLPYRKKKLVNRKKPENLMNIEFPNIWGCTHLGECLTGSQEVKGSISFISTKPIAHKAKNLVGFSCL